MTDNARRQREMLARADFDQQQVEYTAREWSAEYDEDEEERERSRLWLVEKDMGDE